MVLSMPPRNHSHNKVMVLISTSFSVDNSCMVVLLCRMSVRILSAGLLLWFGCFCMYSFNRIQNISAWLLSLARATTKGNCLINKDNSCFGFKNSISVCFIIIR